MVEYLVVSDNHFVSTSSVITKRGEEYSSRLENQIKSLVWVDSFNLPVLHLGDFFEKDVLTAEEISCLKLCKEKVDFSRWTFLQGNHGFAGGFDVMNIFNKQVISEPTTWSLDGENGFKIRFLPFRSKEEDLDQKYDLVLGHIGVEGIPYGARGFSPGLIQSRSNLFLNGHLHNRSEFLPNCHNIGSLTAQNFSDECSGAEKGAWKLRIADGKAEVTFIRNPHAFNFYKLRYADISKVDIPNIETSCMSVVCTEEQQEEVRNRYKGAYYLRVNIQRNHKKEALREIVISVDYIDKFKKSFVEKYGDQGYVLEELAELG